MPPDAHRELGPSRGDRTLQDVPIPDGCRITVTYRSAGPEAETGFEVAIRSADGDTVLSQASASNLGYAFDLADELVRSRGGGLLRWTVALEWCTELGDRNPCVVIVCSDTADRIHDKALRAVVEAFSDDVEPVSRGLPPADWTFLHSVFSGDLSHLLVNRDWLNVLHITCPTSQLQTPLPWEENPVHNAA